jgi:hypothetical protein
MLETGPVLMTWQLASEPACAADLPVLARRIADHRKAYLEYEGPLTRNRGHVDRVDAGTYRAIRRDDTRWEFELQGGRLTGRFALVHDAARDTWRLVQA